MSEDKKPNHHATAWIVTLIALPVLYVLSWGPVYSYGAFDPFSPHYREWLCNFYQPVSWLHDNTPLGEPLDAYYYWWFKVLNKP